MRVFGVIHFQDFFSNWVEVTCAVWAVLGLTLAVCEKPPPYLVTASNAVNACAHTAALLLVILYWGLMPTDQIVFTCMSVHQHALLGAILTADVLITGPPIR